MQLFLFKEGSSSCEIAVDLSGSGFELVSERCPCCGDLTQYLSTLRRFTVLQIPPQKLKLRWKEPFHGLKSLFRRNSSAASFFGRQKCFNALSGRQR